ncbi:hypothetical protein [Aequorivita antarctica]|uniref:Uncharacterized protein n=1 Tax=Aequorivita antarctica TaxID=153266 RepID=A0A5C6YYS8_9FLAO|nr:hypothetical protein [Aequorivita antarctica]TXD72779.1 hypothetical protein ESU54_11200 [Aequorivita antarctica]SRX76221.1 hypothetical protein AEQU3_03220 [Aequorivita antarctica]
MNQITFKQITGTQLYKPQIPSTSEALLFFPFETSIQELITLDNSWANNPKGYYLFFNKIPDSDFSTLELALKKILPVPHPSHTSFAWILLDIGESIKIDNAKIVILEDNERNPPTIKHDVIFQPVNGTAAILFAAESPVLTKVNGDGAITEFNFTYPNIPVKGGQPASMSPSCMALMVPMSGQLSGAFIFKALINRQQESNNLNNAVKDLFEGKSDPLRPFDSKRNGLTFTGNRFVLTQDANNGYTLQPYG